MTRNANISRRQALARLGLGVATAYMSPVVTGLSQARASTASPASKPSAQSKASPPSKASPASKASPPSRASRPSRPSSPSASSSPSGPGNQGSNNSKSKASVPSGPENECRVSGGGGQMTISKQEYRQAQTAIRQGKARPLSEVVKIARERYPGQPVRVGFSSGSGEPQYHIQIVTKTGAIISVTVAARSGTILRARRC